MSSRALKTTIVGAQQIIERWGYGPAALIGFLAGLVGFMVRSWVSESATQIRDAVPELALATLAGTLAGCATAFLQRYAAKRERDRLERSRKIRIAQATKSR